MTVKPDHWIIEMAKNREMIKPFSESEIPGRTVFYGAGHSKYPAKLNIAFTEP